MHISLPTPPCAYTCNLSLLTVGNLGTVWIMHEMPYVRTKQYIFAYVVEKYIEIDNYAKKLYTELYY